jgi:hypothetical protein
MGNVEGGSMSPSDFSSFGQEQVHHAYQDSPQGEQQQDLPLLGLHQAIEEAGAYQNIQKERHRQTLKMYLTTTLPMIDLQELAGVNGTRQVGNIIHRSLQKAFSHLPKEVQDEYKNPKEAIRRKSGRMMPVTHERQREKLIDKETGTFHHEHRQHISEATRRRWQHEREQNA